MIEVSEKAAETIKEMFRDQEKIPSIRVTIEAGWAGPSLGLVLDEPVEDDRVFTLGGITYVVNKDLFERVRPIKVDFIEKLGGGGFFIFSNLGQEAGSGSC